MKEHERVETIILEALEKAEQRGQPVEELLQAIARGEEIETRIEPADSGKVTLTIAIKE